MNYYGEHSYSWELEESLSPISMQRAQRLDALKAWGRKVPGRCVNPHMTYSHTPGRLQVLYRLPVYPLAMMLHTVTGMFDCAPCICICTFSGVYVCGSPSGPSWQPPPLLGWSAVNQMI